MSVATAVTNTIKLGTSILNIVVRSPVICAKALSAIDLLSSGRLFAAGVGPGSHKGDYDVCGIPFEQRCSRFNEALEILHILWMDKESLTQLKNVLTLVDPLEKNVTTNMDIENTVEQIGAIKVEITNILKRENF